MNRKIILIVGNCGSGKTWVMNQLLKDSDQQKYKLGKFCFHETDKSIVVGKYDGSVFEGSDKLSMAVMADLDKMLDYISRKDKVTVFEGDRFSNGKFINKCDPTIIKITDDGQEGRRKRGSNQTERHLKSITTRVRNIKAHLHCKDSDEALKEVSEIIEDNDRRKTNRPD